ncbi:helix-hairpin-helix domain-containing protein [Cryobacterium sp. PH31-O1]|uniref:helix-hairpin-helix domain-containing protein n=1 Tax=Cryobacterium sp. PH31-O1 TaxID=3046306 RepID=UPI0024B97C5F|nr:helix-hairpin-helix domain-containing protein [Cryobacterium sp. PH31-O1]MDJ0338804.1 helix-hairpin-helix domain-containing protein [Cryobacterium sp. PH31-O1]
MQPDRSPLDLERLAPTARGRPRLRVGVGAAVVLLLLALVVAVIVSAVGQQAGQRTVGSATVSLPSGSVTADPLAAGESAAPGDSGAGVIMFVHVLGAVTRPGLFELHDGARVMDAIAAAGGLTPEADPAGVNLARILSDGEQFYVPRQGEVPPSIPAAAAGSGSGGANAPAAKVNLNTATVADLDSLPRIGPTMAQRIIDFRTTNGRFTSVDGLRDVAGIGDKTFEALKDLITI